MKLSLIVRRDNLIQQPGAPAALSVPALSRTGGENRMEKFLDWDEDREIAYHYRQKRHNLEKIEIDSSSENKHKN